MGNAKLTAFCVGQGDALRLKFGGDACPFRNVNFQIDLGPSATRDFLDTGGEWVLALTHSHADHIGGLSAWAASLPTSGVKYWELWLPAYYDEVVRVAEFLQAALTRLAFTPKHSPTILRTLALRQLIGALASPLGRHRPIVRCVWEERTMTWGAQREPCGHLSILNPPYLPAAALGIRPAAAAKLFDGSRVRDDIASRLLALVPDDDVPAWRDYFAGDSDHATLPPLIYGAEADGPVFAIHAPFPLDPALREAGPDAADRRRFFVAVLMRHISRLERFAAGPRDAGWESLTSHIQKDLNNVSIVLSYREDPTGHVSEKGLFLLTGDAGKPVFQRLMRRSSIAHRVLKVPHHGSHHNIDAAILGAIDPEAALISHGNGKFGRAKDPHPNQEVLDLLDAHRAQVLLTTDAVKPSEPTRPRTLGTHMGGLVVVGP